MKLLNEKPNYLWKANEILKNASENNKLFLEEKIKQITEKSSVIHFYFKETGIVLYLREELYGIMDLIGKSSIFYI